MSSCLQYCLKTIDRYFVLNQGLTAVDEGQILFDLNQLMKEWPLIKYVWC